MANQIRYITILLMTAVALCVSSMLSAQDETSQTSAESTSAGTTRDIVFENTQDSSLFVGYYQLNPGDSIRVQLITTIIENYDVMVDDDGYIAIPVVGRVQVVNRTLIDVQTMLQELVDQYYQNAWIMVRLLNLARIKIYIYGDITSPGFYTVNSATTFLDLLQTFKLTNNPEHRRIVHVRGDIRNALPEPREMAEENVLSPSELARISLDMYNKGEYESIDPRVTIIDPLDFSLEGEIEEKNFYLNYGDVIYVPDPDVLIKVEGFRRSGLYEVLPHENLTDIIELAGEPGFSRDISNLILERYDEEGQLTQIFYNLNYLDDASLDKVTLENRDRLTLAMHQNNVYVLGEVNEAGAYMYDSSLTPLDYLTLAGGPTPEAHLRFSVLIRPPRDPESPMENSEIYNVDFGATLLEGSYSSPVVIEPGDILFIPDVGEELTMTNVLSGLSILVNAVRLFQ